MSKSIQNSLKFQKNMHYAYPTLCIALRLLVFIRQKLKQQICNLFLVPLRLVDIQTWTNLYSLKVFCLAKRVVPSRMALHSPLIVIYEPVEMLGVIISASPILFIIKLNSFTAINLSKINKTFHSHTKYLKIEKN